MTAAFKTELVPAILAGTKIHTFREGQRWKPTYQIDFYINARRKDMARFRPSAPVASLQAAELRTEGFYLDGRLLDPLEHTLFARQDGFASTEELLAFFAGRAKPLMGQLIHWTPFRYLGPDEAAAPATVADYLCRLAEAQPGGLPYPQQAALLRSCLTSLGTLEATMQPGRPCTVTNLTADLVLLNPADFLREQALDQQNGAHGRRLVQLLGDLTGRLARRT